MTDLTRLERQIAKELGHEGDRSLEAQAAKVAAELDDDLTSMDLFYDKLTDTRTFGERLVDEADQAIKDQYLKRAARQLQNAAKSLSIAADH